MGRRVIPKQKIQKNPLIKVRLIVKINDYLDIFNTKLPRKS